MSQRRRSTFEAPPVFLADSRLGRGDYTRRSTEALRNTPVDLTDYDQLLGGAS